MRMTFFTPSRMFANGPYVGDALTALGVANPTHPLTAVVAQMEDSVIIVLTPEQAQDIVDGQRSGDWICSLSTTLSDEAESWSPTPPKTWRVYGSVSMSGSTSMNVEAISEEEAIEKFDEAMEDLDVDDVEDLEIQDVESMDIYEV